MKFDDNNLKIHIKSFEDTISFKAYLEESDITFDILDTPLPFAPTNFKNVSIANRVNQKAKFTFNVFSEDRIECIKNYENLQKMLFIIKPLYYQEAYEILPQKTNTTGYLTLKFNGLPYDEKEINLHLKNFSYQINKDLGYLHVPKEELNLKSDFGKYSFETQHMKLIPISYKISIEAKIILPVKKTIRLTNSSSLSITNKVEKEPPKQIIDNTGISLKELGATNKQQRISLILADSMRSYPFNLSIYTKEHWKYILDEAKKLEKYFNEDGSINTERGRAVGGIAYNSAMESLVRKIR